MNLLKIVLISFLLCSIPSVLASSSIQKEIDRDIWHKYKLSYDTNDGPMHVSFHHKDFVRVVPKDKKIDNGETYFHHVLEWMNKAKQNKLDVSINFRFLERVNNDETAFETVIYHYQQNNSEGKKSNEYGLFKVIHKKINGHWQLALDLALDSVAEDVWDKAPIELSVVN